MCLEILEGVSSNISYSTAPFVEAGTEGAGAFIALASSFGSQRKNHLCSSGWWKTPHDITAAFSEVVYDPQSGSPTQVLYEIAPAFANDLYRVEVYPDGYVRAYSGSWPMTETEIDTFWYSGFEFEEARCQAETKGTLTHVPTAHWTNVEVKPKGFGYTPPSLAHVVKPVNSNGTVLIDTGTELSVKDSRVP